MMRTFYGRIDGLVNSASIARAERFLDTALTDFDRIVAVNLRGSFLLAGGRQSDGDLRRWINYQHRERIGHAGYRPEQLSIP
jgi:hypothetical protein